MTMKNKSINIYVVIAFLSLAYPMLVGLMNNNTIPNLVGIVINPINPDSLLKKDKNMWFSGEYQTLKDDYNNDHWAFKEKFVRLNNQFYYDVFNQLRVNRFVSGKDNYVFSETFIYSAYGDDYIGQSKISEKIRKAKVIQDTLKKKGIDLFFVFAPGKGEYCSEQIDDKYKHPITNTNYKDYISLCKQNNVNTLDLKAYFQLLKPNTPYPLFPKFGHHWSYYGECLAVDTIIKFVEQLHRCDLPDMSWDEIDVVDTARSRDADVLNSMNLYYSPKQNQKLAYPRISFEKDSLKNKTKVLTVADSYWYGPVYMGVPQNCFASGSFWYYYNKIIPNPSWASEKVEVWQLDLKQEIESNQVIMLLYSDGNLASYSNAFIDDVYELYTNPKLYYQKNEKNKALKTNQKLIRETPNLLKKSTKKSQDLQIPLDSAIKIDAMKMLGVQ
jgi:hypothetical protein